MADTPEHSLQINDFFKECDNSQTASQVTEVGLVTRIFSETFDFDSLKGGVS
jgi:hypothetical protein